MKEIQHRGGFSITGMKGPQGRDLRIDSKPSELLGQPPARQRGPKSNNLELNSANHLRELEVDLSLVEPPAEDTAGRYLDPSLVRPKQRTQLKGVSNCSIINFC